MDPATVGMAAGSMASNIFMQERTNRQNRSMAREQMRFQQSMSDTAHQREVKDLVAAGLNPTLSAGGGGASTPSGASATMQAPQIDLPAMLQVAQLDQNQQRIDIEKTMSVAGMAKTMSDTDLNKMKKILLQKGMIKAQLEGEASTVMQNILKFMKKQWNQNQPQPVTDSILMQP